MVQNIIRVFIFISFFGVQSNVFAEDKHHEFSPAIGFYNGDALRSSVLGGASYNYHFNSAFWLGAEFQGGTLAVDEPNGLQLKSGQKFLMTDAVFTWNLPSLIGATRDNAKDGYAADLYTSIGAGQLWAGYRSEPYGIIGGGLLIHFPISYLAVKFDLKGLFFVLSNDQGSNFNADSILSIGPALLF